MKVSNPVTASFLLILLASFPLALLAADEDLVGDQTVGGAFYAIYPNGGAAAECVVDAGTKVDTSCCAALTPQPLLAGITNDNTCFTFTGSIRAFKGCSADGTSLYGENCAEGDAANVTIGECGCQFKLEGTGCYKANDFPDDPRQFFVYLDDKHDCPKDAMSAAAGSLTTIVTALMTISIAAAMSSMW